MADEHYHTFHHWQGFDLRCPRCWQSVWDQLREQWTATTKPWRCKEQPPPKGEE